MRKKRLGEVLRDRKRVSDEVLQQALAEQQKNAGLLGELLLDRALVSKDDLVSALEEVTHFRYVDARYATVERVVLKLVPKAAALRYGVLPLIREGKKIVAVMSEPQNLHILDELRFLTGMDVSPRLGFKSEINEAVEKCYADEQGEPVTAAAEQMPFIEQVDV